MTRGIFNTLCILSLITLLAGCNKIDELTKFDIKYETSVTVSSSTVLDLPVSLQTPDVETNSESEFASNNTRKDLVEEITLKSCRMNITSPTDGNFGFLKSISVYISAEGLSETKIAWKDEIPAGIGNELILETSPENLKEYISKDSYRLRVNTVTDQTIQKDHEIDIESIFHVDARILGI